MHFGGKRPFKAMERLNESMREAGRDEWWEFQDK